MSISDSVSAETASAAAPAAAASASAPVRPASVNRIGETMASYKGGASTLCAGCGHDSITSQLIKAFFETGVSPYDVAKMSGIGCSSKTTAYFMSLSHGFNGVHGRAAAIATGSYLANRHLVHVCVSGDGDTASIGLGHFLHMLRRNLPIVYVIENNGVYGLTKGQFSATADKGSTHKKGFSNEQPPIDCCALAIEMGCGYVARSFSGDVKQLVPLLKGAIAHRGSAVVDVVSPCVTFNNHEGSTKSLKFARENENPLHEVGFVPYFEPVTADYEEGSTITVDLPDGSKLLLRKLDHDHDPRDKMRALELCHLAMEQRLFLTGLIYQSPVRSQALAEQLNLVDVPLAHLPEELVRPGPAPLAEVMEAHR